MLKKIKMKINKMEWKKRLDYYLYIERPINKMGKVIFKQMKGSTPSLSKQDCYGIAMCISWNDADGMKKYLSYTDEYGNRVFPK